MIRIKRNERPPHYEVRKVEGTYWVINRWHGRVESKHTTKEAAETAIEHFKIYVRRIAI